MPTQLTCYLPPWNAIWKGEPHYSQQPFCFDVEVSNKRSELRGTLPPTQKLACFVLYLKIINIFLKKKKKNYMHQIGNCPKNSNIASKFR